MENLNKILISFQIMSWHRHQPMFIMQICLWAGYTNTDCSADIMSSSPGWWRGQILCMAAGRRLSFLFSNMSVIVTIAKLEALSAFDHSTHDIRV